MRRDTCVTDWHGVHSGRLLLTRLLGLRDHRSRFSEPDRTALPFHRGQVAMLLEHLEVDIDGGPIYPELLSKFSHGGSDAIAVLHFANREDHLGLSHRKQSVISWI